MKNRIRALCMALLVGAFVAGCGGDHVAPTGTAAPAPTLSAEDKLTITGRVDLTEQEDRYVVTCTSDIPEGAFVTVYLMDDLDNLLDLNEDVMQKNGVCTASFATSGVNGLAQQNGAHSVLARVEFVSSSAAQPQEIQDRYGSLGARLSGDNVVEDANSGAAIVRMESAQVDLP